MPTLSPNTVSLLSALPILPTLMADRGVSVDDKPNMELPLLATLSCEKAFAENKMQTDKNKNFFIIV